MKKRSIISFILGLSWIGTVGFPLPAVATSGDSVAWFLKTTQALHDAIGTGDKSIWERTLADNCIFTDEDGEVLTKAEFLKDLGPLPKGFSGGQKVQDLTVRDLGNAAVVHFWLDEWEDVFGDKLRTKYVETDTYSLEGDTWKMIAAQVTVVPRDLAPVTVDTRGWPELLGEYQLGEKSNWLYHVSMRNKALYWGRNEKSARLLIPLSPLVFFEKGSIHTLVFVRNAAGTVTEVLELHKYNEVVMQRVPKNTKR